MQALFEAAAMPTAPLGLEDVFWRGLRKVVTDGTVFDLPASDDNAPRSTPPPGAYCRRPAWSPWPSAAAWP
jgi:hypothetical protein